MKSQATVKNHVASHVCLVLHICQVTSEFQGFLVAVFQLPFN